MMCQERGAAKAVITCHACSLSLLARETSLITRVRGRYIHRHAQVRNSGGAVPLKIGKSTSHAHFGLSFYIWAAFYRA